MRWQIHTDMENKKIKCIRCNEEKNNTEFYIYGGCLRTTCKDCKKKSSKKRYKSNKVEHLQKCKEYRDLNKEYYTKYKKEYSQRDYVKTKERNRSTKRRPERKGYYKEWELKSIIECKNNYIISLLKQQGFTKEQIKDNPELIEVKRIIIKTKRL